MTSASRGPYDVTVASPARVTDYLNGGDTNYSSDRQEAAKVLGKWPNVANNARDARAWVARVVGYLAEEGIDQYLDVGSGLPTQENVHEMAQRVVPRARVWYTDNDPIVFAHGRTTLEHNAHTRYGQGDVREPEAIVDAAAEHLDLQRPVAVLLAAVLHYVSDDPADLARRLMQRLPSGSYLAVSHVIGDDVPRELQEALGTTFGGGMLLRPAAQVATIFDGLDLVEPGLVDVQKWRPEQESPVSELRLLSGVARKP